MSYTLALLTTCVGIYLPNPLDKDGIGLRICNLSDRGPYLRGETLSECHLDIMLVNHSKGTLVHDPFEVARLTQQLKVSVTDPDGKPLHSLVRGQALLRDPFTAEQKLQPGEFSSQDSQFRSFGRWSFLKTGRYQIQAIWTIDGRKLTSPPLEMVVVAVPPEAVLSGIRVVRDDKEVRPSGPFVQQVKVGEKTLLIYTGSGTHRLAELPAKVEVSVEGLYGPASPLTIKYADAKSKTGTTTLVINSLTGTPWTAEEERSRQETLNPKKDAPPSKP